MRLDGFVSKATGASRKDARRLITQGRVCIDDRPCRNAGQRITDQDAVTLNGEHLTIAGHRYLMLHKPRGLVCSHSDNDGTSVMTLLPYHQRSDLRIVGRLDKDTSGLLLLTTDGEWLHRVTSPRYHLEKTYLATLTEPLSADRRAQLERGILLKNDTRPTRPARLEKLGDCQLRITITEGRYHQVRRMMAAAGSHVSDLHRERIGGVTLDDTLAPGAWRDLSSWEIQHLSHP